MPFEMAICCSSGRGKASVLWLMACYVYFKWWRVPLLSSYGDFRSKLLAALLVYRTLSFYYSILFLSREWLKLVSHTNLYSFTSTLVSRFFKELEKKHEQNIVIDDITDIVCKHSQSSFDPYITYCSNEVYQQRTLQRLVWVTEQSHTYTLLSYHSWIWSNMAVPLLPRPSSLFSPSAASASLFPYSSKNPTFKEVLTRIEGHPDCRNLPMISFLILPMQRITRLPLLMDVSALKTYSRASLGITRLPLAQQFVYLCCPC